MTAIVDTSGGDARRALTTLEVATQLCLQEGRKEGLQEGLQQGRLEVARAMLTSGLDSTLIAQVTGLPAETIATLGVSKP